MDKKIFNAEKAPAAVGPYSHGARVGDMLFLSGQIPLDPATGQIVDGGIAAQTKRVLENIANVLEAQGAKLADVVKTTIYLTDMNDFPVVNETYAGYFSEPFPARTTVAVAALPKGAAVEIEVIAAV